MTNEQQILVKMTNTLCLVTFQNVLESLGAEPHVSIHLDPNGQFPNGVPNPEYAPMFETTIAACERTQADLGIMLDTDADRYVCPLSRLQLHPKCLCF